MIFSTLRAWWSQSQPNHGRIWHAYHHKELPKLHENVNYIDGSSGRWSLQTVQDAQGTSDRWIRRHCGQMPSTCKLKWWRDSTEYAAFFYTELLYSQQRHTQKTYLSMLDHEKKTCYFLGSVLALWWSWNYKARRVHVKNRRDGASEWMRGEGDGYII